MRPSPEQIQAMTPVEETPWIFVTFIIIGSAVLAWVFARSLKGAFEKKVSLDEGVSIKEARKRLWWTPLLTLAGGVLGFGLGAFVAAFEWRWYYGGLCGSIGGGMASFIVGVLEENLPSLLKRILSRGAKDG